MKSSFRVFHAIGSRKNGL